MTPEYPMIENAEVAKYVSRTFLHINDQLDQSIVAIEKDVSPEELKAYKRGVGYVLYEIFEKLLDPLYQQHPELKPRGLGR